MADLDGELRRRFHELGDHVDTEGILDLVRARTRRRRFVRRARAVSLVATVVAATALGGFLLTRAFRPGEKAAPGASIRLTGNGPIYFVRGSQVLRAPGGGSAAIYRMSADGSAVERITGTLSGPGSLTWSPDGTRLAFTRSGGEFESSNLYVMNADGSGLEQITHYSDGVLQAGTPEWSPDGRILAFTRVDAGESDAELFTVHPDGSGMTQLTHCVERCGSSNGAAGPSWSPDGSSIVFGRDRDLWVVRADGSDPRRLTDYAEDPCCSLVVNPAWSPDGAEIVFVLDQDPAFSLWAIHPDGSGLREIYDCAGPDCLGVLEPTWSPDGRYIAFTWIGPAPRTSRHVAVISPDGSGLQVLTDAPPDACCPAWQPVDGNPTPTTASA
jgi:Tol biopolymer transport system component